METRHDIIVGDTTGTTQVASDKRDSSHRCHPEREHGPCFIVGGIADPMRQR
jgi:hypothetical protein